MLEGEQPRLIDEWQDAPKIWDAVRIDIDRSNSRGGFILTSSNVPNETAKQEMIHSGTGRISRVRMHTMSLYESGESTGEISLKGLFDGNPHCGPISALTLDGLAFALCRGGWPSAVIIDNDCSMDISRAYVDCVTDGSISDGDGVRRNRDIMRRLLKCLSGSICTMKSTTAVSEELKGVASRPTVIQYIDALRSMFVIDDVPPWMPPLLSKARLSRTRRICFSDPSIATASLGITPESLIRDMPLFGSLFESLVIRDLRVYSQAMDGDVRHYHDTTGLDVDAIVTLDDGRWCAIDVRLSGDVEKSARNLIRFKDKTELADGSDPSFLAVITGTGFYHVRPDGVIVIPIGCLGP